MRIAHLLLFATATALCSMAVRAQTPAPGSLVRLSIDGERRAQKGHLTLVTADSVFMTAREGNSLRYARARVRRVELGTKGDEEGEYAFLGFLGGGAIGIGAGAALGAAVGSAGGKSARVAAGVGGGIIGGLLGAFFGSELGSAITPVHWRDVELEPRVGSRARGLTMHIAF
ncbi:MAG TPA: hypothetical protein VHM30_03015 [Gemmatimonadaceae bacterium]|nr:hypothetical protein [Gemmatimonadaceae bacterium]